MKYKIEKTDFRNKGFQYTFINTENKILLIIRDAAIYLVAIIGIYLTLFSPGTYNLSSIPPLMGCGSLELSGKLFRSEDRYILITILVIVVTVLKSRNLVYTESLLIVPSVGVSLKTIHIFWNVSSSFFYLKKVKDIVILEAFSKQSVTCYLALLLHGDIKDKIYPIFVRFNPSTEVMQEICRKTQILLHSNISAQTDR